MSTYEGADLMVFPCPGCGGDMLTRRIDGKPEHIMCSGCRDLDPMADEAEDPLERAVRLQFTHLIYVCAVLRGVVPTVAELWP